jgi:deoxyribodipyrimidine photo-lyase
VELAERFGRPLVVLEALRCDYRWASDRLHRFVLDGMAENARRFAGRAVLYHPYLEAAPRACSPTRGVRTGGRRLTVFLPAAHDRAGRAMVPCGGVDSCPAPIRASSSTAHAFRAFIQRTARTC